MIKNAKISVIIPNWNGRKRLQKCLESFKRVTYKNLEFIVVNNGSTDDTALFLKKHYPKIRVINVYPNRGYAGATNLGVQQAKGKYILLINNDTTVTLNFLQPLVEDMEKDKTIGAVQPQIRSMIYPKLLDSVGSFLTSTGFLYHYGYMKPHDKKIYSKQLFAYSIKGACVLMRRNDYLTLGGLDESFVCYVEETDLCHRIWLFGKKVLYEPKSVIYHWGGGDMQVMTKDYVTMYRSFRNRIVSYEKNLSIFQLFAILPLTILFSEGYIVLSLLQKRFVLAFGAQAGTIVGIFSIFTIREKRKYIQEKLRKVTDKEIMPYIKRDPQFSYYYRFFKDPKSYKD